MAHEDLIAIAFGAALLCGACGGAATPAAAAAGAAPPATAAVAAAPPSVEDPPPGALDRFPRFHSKRFNLWLPLPEGKTWRIDDHSRPELVATHAATHATVVVAVSSEDALMSRSTCEERARARGLVPRREMRTIEDTAGITLDEFDTRVWVAIEPPATQGAPVVGHTFAFGGFLRKCIFFHYASEAPGGDAGERDLATRLALARTRIYGDIAIDPFALAPRETRATRPPPAPR